MAELLAFTADHVRRLTGLSTRQIRYWDDTEFFSPTLVEGHRRRAFGRIYTFRDVVGLRTIAILRKQHRIPLQELRRVGAWLHQHHRTPWSSLSFALAGRRVVFFDPISKVALEPRDKGQVVFSAYLFLEPIANEMHRAAAKLRERGSEEHGKIIRNRFVQHNAWVFSATP